MHSISNRFIPLDAVHDCNVTYTGRLGGARVQLRLPVSRCNKSVAFYRCAHARPAKSDPPRAIFAHCIWRNRLDRAGENAERCTRVANL